MADPRGALKVTAAGQDYTLWLGMSGLAELQARHGQDVLQKLDPPEGAGEAWVPDLNIVLDLLLASLQRHHADADRFTADEIFAENEGVVLQLLAAAFPEQEPAPGNAKTPKRAPGNGRRPKRAA